MMEGNFSFTVSLFRLVRLSKAIITGRSSVFLTYSVLCLHFTLYSVELYSINAGKSKILGLVLDQNQVVCGLNPQGREIISSFCAVVWIRINKGTESMI